MRHDVAVQLKKTKEQKNITPKPPSKIDEFGHDFAFSPSADIVKGAGC